MQIIFITHWLTHSLSYVNVGKRKFQRGLYLHLLDFDGEGAQWLSGRVLDSRPRGRRFEPHQGHCPVSLSKTHLPLLSTVSTQEDPSLHN